MNANILIVDDESNIRLMLKATLATDGYTLGEAASGREALETIVASTPDLIVLDLNMPEMDGMALLRQIKLLPPSKRPRIIVLTAHGSITRAVEATHLGAADFLEKPVMPADLRLSVACVLDEPPESTPAVLPTPAAMLDRAKQEISRGDVGRAEELLMRAAEIAETDPAYFNLLGVVYETEGRRHLAKKCYLKAVEANGRYEPARNNLKRLREIESRGTSGLTISLGDEANLTRRIDFAAH